MKVIDSSALVKYFSRESGWERVASVIAGGTVTLDMAIKEVANALWKKCVKGEMREETALEIVKDLSSGEPIKILEEGDYLLQAVRIALNKKITVYDALFIALAKSLGLPLVTSDEKQAEAARAEGVAVELL